MQQILDVAALRVPQFQPTAGAAPRTGGRMCAEQRSHRLETWAEFIESELQSRNMRPAQLALYANVNASTVSVWRHRKSLPDREAVGGVARCFHLPVEYVAEKAGMLPPAAPRPDSRIESDPDWRGLLAEIDRLPHEQFARIKLALRAALGGRRS